MGALAVGTKTLHGINGLHRIDSIISERNPPLYFTLTSITMQGHQNKNKEHHESRYTVYFDQEFRTTAIELWS